MYKTRIYCQNSTVSVDLDSHQSIFVELDCKLDHLDCLLDRGPATFKAVSKEEYDFHLQ